MKPQRTCIVCRNKFDKDLLVRISKDANDNLCVGSNVGRGMYICKSEQCKKNLVSKKVINKVFKKQISDQVYKQVLDGVQKHE